MRDIESVIQSILGVLPAEGYLQDLRTDLSVLRTMAHFQPAEASTDLWAELGRILAKRMPVFDPRKEPEWMGEVATIARGL